MLKKIFIMIALVVSALALTINASYAVLVEKTLNLNIISNQTLNNYSLRSVVDVGDNMYQRLSQYTGWNQSYDNSDNPLLITIKKGSLSYEGRISHDYHVLWANT